MSEKSKNRERKRWLKRYIGHFGEPPLLLEYHAGNVSFYDLYHQSVRSAELAVAEIQSIKSEAFE